MEYLNGKLNPPTQMSSNFHDRMAHILLIFNVLYSPKFKCPKIFNNFKCRQSTMWSPL